MNLVNVSAALNAINPNATDPIDPNPDGNCSECASDAGAALVSGANPGQAAANDFNYTPQTLLPRHPRCLVIRRFPLGIGGGQNVWRWLSTHAASGVYLVDQEGDHCYNFVKHNGNVYLVDSNLQVCLQIAAPVQAVHQIAAYQVDYDYLDPEPEDHGDQLTFYYFGPLHPNWL